MRGRRRGLRPRSRLRLRPRLRWWITVARQIPARSSTICRRGQMSASGAKASISRITQHASRHPDSIWPHPGASPSGTAPPGAAELRAALERVKPHTVILFGVDPGFGSPSAFLGRLAGLIKHALQRTRRSCATLRACGRPRRPRGDRARRSGVVRRPRGCRRNGSKPPPTSSWRVGMAQSGQMLPRLPPASKPCWPRPPRIARILPQRIKTGCSVDAPLPTRPLTHSLTLVKEVPPCVSASWQCRSAR